MKTFEEDLRDARLERALLVLVELRYNTPPVGVPSTPIYRCWECQDSGEFCPYCTIIG